MKIEAIHDDCLRVWLAEEELQQWGLQEDEPQRSRVHRLVRRVLATVGRHYPRVTAELIPVEGGGVLLVSPDRSLPTGGLWVYRITDPDHLLALWERWPAEEPVPVCALYELGAEYRLAVYPEGALTPAQRHLLLEYGIPLTGGEGAVAHAAEYGTLIGLGALFTGCGPRQPATSDRWN